MDDVQILLVGLSQPDKTWKFTVRSLPSPACRSCCSEDLAQPHTAISSLLYRLLVMRTHCRSHPSSSTSYKVMHCQAGIQDECSTAQNSKDCYSIIIAGFLYRKWKGIVALCQNRDKWLQLQTHEGLKNWFEEKKNTHKHTVTYSSSVAIFSSSSGKQQQYFPSLTF